MCLPFKQRAMTSARTALLMRRLGEKKRGHVYHTLARWSVINPIYPLLVHKISGNGSISLVRIVFPAYCTFIHWRIFWMWFTQVFFSFKKYIQFSQPRFCGLKKKKNSLQVSYSTASFTVTLFCSLDAGSLSLLLKLTFCWTFCKSVEVRLVPHNRTVCFILGGGDQHLRYPETAGHFTRRLLGLCRLKAGSRPLSELFTPSRFA